MKIIVCVDDNFGMLFNNRRQSKDQMLLEDMMGKIEKVWIHSFSQKLLEGYEERIVVDDKFLQKAKAQDVCFVENQHLLPYLDKIEEIVLYKWNRKYPSDMKFDIDMEKWELSKQEGFEGKSHEKITCETYIRRL